MSKLIDRFGRHINYARLSVTDRCDFRCVYCMAEEMSFLPKSEVLSLEELYLVARGLVDSGITKIRLTGGEPLVRNNIMWLVEKLGAIDGLEELTLTTNGSQLTKYASSLRDAGVARLNISIDSLVPEKFRQITRTGKLEQVLDGIDAAVDAGFKKLKLNSVILKNRNDDEVIPLLEFAISRGIDISYIEEMPLGDIVEHNRALAFFSSEAIRETISTRYRLQEVASETNGPSRYFSIESTGPSDKAEKSITTKVGFISPHSNNFCSECNRIRVTVEGRLLFCLGNEHSIDLRAPIRKQGLVNDEKKALVSSLIKSNLHLKPEQHHFDLEGPVEIVRFMNMTGG